MSVKDKRASRTRVRDSRQRKTTYKIYVEGKKTEIDYFRFFKDYNKQIGIQIESGSKPQPDKLLEQANRDKRNSDFTEIWLVFDVDDNPNLLGTIKNAEKSGFQVAVSNPCFELWLILHHKDHNAFAKADYAQTALENIANSGYTRRNKAIEERAKSVYIANARDAVDRAKTLENRHNVNGTQFPNDNPSSRVYKLVEKLI